MSYLDDLGFHRTRLDQRLVNLEASAQGIFGTDIDLAPDSADGQYLGILAEAAADADSLLEDVYDQRSPSGATGAQLARIALINGVKKKVPVFGTGLVTLTGTAGAAVPAGSLVGSSLDSTAIFATLVSGTVGGPDVAVQSTVTGVGVVPAGDLTVVKTVISGWTGVTNAADTVAGTLGETDGALRARRLASVALPSQGIVDGLLGALLNIEGVTQAKVRENQADTTQTLADGGTLVAHAIECMVLGGASADIAKTIWLKRSAGVTMVGSTMGTYVDSQGTTQTINWTTPQAHVVYTAIHTPVALSGGAQVAIKAAIVAWAAGNLLVNGVALPAMQIGAAVRWSQMFIPINVLLYGAQIIDPVTGDLTNVPVVPELFTNAVSSIDIGNSPGPTLQDDIVIAYTQYGDFSDPAKITFVAP